MASNADADNGAFHDALETQKPRTFHQFSLLHEDLQVFILSFVSQVPFEDPQCRSLLTHTLPYVSHHFHAMCQSDYLWQEALERLVVKDPALWVPGLLKLVSNNVDSNGPKFVSRVHQALNEPGFIRVFQMVVARHLRFTGPVFIMSGVVRLGQGIALHFFEPRYRTLIARVLEDWPDEAREGAPIEANANGDYPTFVYAHTAPFAPTTPACLVRVQQCTIHHNGSADVLLIPVAYVYLERLWEAPNTGRLHYAQCLRMPTVDIRRMEEETIQPQVGFENPLITALLQDRGLLDMGGANVGLEGPLRALLSYMVHEHGDEQFDSDDDDENGGAGVPAD